MKHAWIPSLLVLCLLFVPAQGFSAAPSSHDTPCIPIKELVLSGNTHFSSTRLKLRMKTWTTALLPGSLGCLNPSWVKADIQNLTAFYLKKQYADVKIESAVTPVNGTQKHRVEIFITEGPRYEINFTGNTHFSRRRLMKEISVFEKGDPNGAGLRRGRTAIKKKYRQAGFADVTVTLDTQLVPGKRGEIKKITYTITPGTRRVVRQLTVVGNHGVETKKILEAMLTHPETLTAPGGFNADTLAKDLEAVALVYYSHGFLNAAITHEMRVETPKPSSAAEKKAPVVESVFITLHVIEGPRTQVQTARISGLDNIVPMETADKTIHLSPGAPFRDYMVKSDANALAALVSEKGYPHVQVKGDARLNPDKTGADIVWQVTPGPFTRFGEIHFKGNDRLKESILQRKVNITPGSPFSLKQLFATQKKIREIHSVASVSITAPGLKQQEPAPDLEVTVQERKPFYVEAAAGFDTERLGYFKAKTGDTNFMGRDMNAWVEGHISGIGHRMEAGVQDPFFLGTRITAGFTVFEEQEEPLNQEFGTRTWGAESAFSRKLWPHLTAGLKFEYENRVQFNSDDDEQEETRNILITSTSLAWDNRDSALKPTRGFLCFGAMDLFTGFDNDLDRFIKYQLDLRHYRKICPRVTLALVGRGGHISPFGGANTVADDQLFFLGGISDVRGFRENMLRVDDDKDALGGLTSLSASLEARIDLPAHLELTLFMDGGKIGETGEVGTADDFRYAVGTGLRYNTPIGPIGLLYGHKLDRKDGESAGRFHLSIGYTF